MPIRVVRLTPRSPIVAALLGVVLLALVLALLVFGLTIAAGVAAVGSVGLLVRRALGLRRPPSYGPARRLDPRAEVFPVREHDPHRTLLPGAD